MVPDSATSCVEQFCTVITLQTSLVFLTVESYCLSRAPSNISHGVLGMKKKTPARKKAKKRAKAAHPGMMGDGTEEQNLGQRGNPAARIKKREVAAAFAKRRRKK
jgi:hypothetical protein